MIKPHYLNMVFSPASVAVIGASEKKEHIGSLIFKNLIEGSYKGKVYAINPRVPSVFGRPTLNSITDIQEEVDMAVIAAPGAALPRILESCGEQGVKSVVLVSPGFHDPDEQHTLWLTEAQAIAKRFSIRILGPNLFGLMRPVLGLNATSYDGAVRSGHLALVSQSTALCSAILDWAEANEVGFSSVISMGPSVDIDFGDILDFLANDYRTQGILIYLEDIQDARRFMSALRAAARTKPVIVLKVGSHLGVHHTALTHSATLVNQEETFSAVLRRAGVLRADTIRQFFTAARVLCANYRTQGENLAIITNGAGPGMLAADRAAALGVPLARLSEETLQTLRAALPAGAQLDNPVDLIGNAPPERFRIATEALIQDPNVDGIVVVFTPQGGTDHKATAEIMLELRKKTKKPLLLCWMGERRVKESRDLLTEAHIPRFRTPEVAVEVFHSLLVYHHNQQILMQVASPLAHHDQPDIEAAQQIIEAAQAEGRVALSEMESKAILTAFRIPTTETFLAKTPDEAVQLAKKVGFPVVMKILSHQVIHKSDVGGVILNVQTEEDVRRNFTEICHRTHEFEPDAVIEGISIQKMHRPRHGRELMVGVTHDPAFGPLINFGSGGVNVEVVRDRTVGMPPLNRTLAEKMIQRTRVSRMLKPFRNMPAADVEGLKDMLLRVSEMVCELPCLMEMDINPVILDEKGPVAVDARIIVSPEKITLRQPYAHMPIHPYPAHLEKQVVLKDGTPAVVRPIRPEDAEMLKAFVADLSEESRYNRYMNTMKELSLSMLVRFTQLDYDREIALVVTTQGRQPEELLAVSRYTIYPDRETCEFAVEVADRWQGRGLGKLAMLELFDAARGQGMKVMEGEVFSNNTNMLGMIESIGFVLHAHPEDSGLKLVVKDLLA